MRRRLALGTVLLMTATSGCTVLRNEWSNKDGDSGNDDRVREAVEQALPDAEEVTVTSGNDGFVQETQVDVTLPDASFDADDLVATARAICDAVELTDAVFVEVIDGSTDTLLDLEGIVALVPALDAPYEPTEVQIEVEDDCPDL
jgi:hypothetical protein